jgi:glycosyltransferase involved in cell wall biosynthesis
MPALLQAADIFTLPSIDLPGQAEGTPTALLEAMAAGLPVVITDSGGGRFVVGASGGGVIVPQRDPGALAEALIALAGDARRRCALGALNQRWAREQDWTIVAGRVVDVYREALAEQGRSR